MLPLLDDTGIDRDITTAQFLFQLILPPLNAQFQISQSKTFEVFCELVLPSVLQT
jgi:hypothetical protein